MTWDQSPGLVQWCGPNSGALGRCQNCPWQRQTQTLECTPVDGWWNFEFLCCIRCPLLVAGSWWP